MFKIIISTLFLIYSLNYSNAFKFNSTIKLSNLKSNLAYNLKNKTKIEFKSINIGSTIDLKSLNSTVNNSKIIHSIDNSTIVSNSKLDQFVSARTVSNERNSSLDNILVDRLEVNENLNNTTNEGLINKNYLNKVKSNANLKIEKNDFTKSNKSERAIIESKKNDSQIISIEDKPSIDFNSTDKTIDNSEKHNSRIHLLGDEDIKEYHNKRKEEDNIKIEHLKELKAKQKNKAKLDTVSIIKRTKLKDDLENNHINHLQEIDTIGGLKIVNDTHKPQLIIVSLDAMRYDYGKMFKNVMSNFHRMAKLGVFAPNGIIAPYITQTIPSHYSIATGLYQESSGIIDNRFYDPKFNESFKPFLMKSKFFEGEPIWSTAVKNGLESRVYFWPGSEAQPSKLSPTEYMKFNLTTSIKDQIDKIIDWSEQGTDLMMFYCSQPDFAGHNFGIASKEMIIAIKEINYEMGILIDYVKQKNINLIVTADHGMVHVDPNKLIILEDYLDFKSTINRIPQFGSIAAIQPKEGKLEQVIQKLSKVPYMKCYKKNDLPEHYHYKNHYRIQPIICIPELAAYIIRTKDDPRPTFGIHGYDNRNQKMSPIFYAFGPDFKQNYLTHPFESINLYSLFAHILHINPAPNNGSIHNIKHILSDISLSRLK